MTSISAPVTHRLRIRTVKPDRTITVTTHDDHSVALDEALRQRVNRLKASNLRFEIGVNIPDPWVRYTERNGDVVTLTYEPVQP